MSTTLYRIDLPKCFQTNNKELYDLVKKFEELRPIQDQQLLTKTLSSHIHQKHEEEYLIKLFCYMYLQTDTCSPMKKTLKRIIVAANTPCLNILFKSQIILILHENVLNYSLVELCRKKAAIISKFSSCFDNFPEAIEILSETIDEIEPFVLEQLLILTQYFFNKSEGFLETEEIYTNLTSCTKFLYCLLKKCSPSTQRKHDSIIIVDVLKKFVLCESIPIEFRKTCAQILVLFMRYLPSSITNFYLFRNNPALELIKEKQDFDEPVMLELPSALICLYSAILNELDASRDLSGEYYKGIPLVHHIFNRILYFQPRFADESTQILLINKTIAQIVNVLHVVDLKFLEIAFKRCLEYVWSNIEHHISSIKHSTLAILDQLTKLAVTFNSNKKSISLLKTMENTTIDFLNSKNPYYQILKTLSIHNGSAYLLSLSTNLPIILLERMDQDAALALPLTNTYELLMERHKKEINNRKAVIVNDWITTWIQPVISKLCCFNDMLVQYLQKIITKAVRLEILVLKELRNFQHLRSPKELTVLLKCLQVLRKSSNSFQTDGNEKELWRNMLEYSTITKLLYHQSDEVRLSTLALIIETNKSTEIFTKFEINFLLEFFKYNISTPESTFREEMLTLYLKMLRRMKDGFDVLCRDKLKQDQMKVYKQFFSLFLNSELKKGLNFDANFSRRYISLELLIFMNENIMDAEEWDCNWTWEDNLQLQEIFSEYHQTVAKLARILIQKSSIEHRGKLLDDAFGFVQSTDPSIVTKGAYIITYLMDDLDEYFKKYVDVIDFTSTEELAIFLLLRKLSLQIETVENDLLYGILNLPLYGYILTIRLIVEKCNVNQIRGWTSLVEMVLDLCPKIWEILGPILSNASPEGFLPDEVMRKIQGKPGDFTDNDGTLSRKVLLFGWRSTKEMSLLVGELAEKLQHSEYQQIFVEKNIDIAKTFYYNLLLVNKHRGAFEQAYLGFSKFCKRLWSVYKEDKAYPQEWLENTLLGLISKEDEFCATRRSAGLPFMLQAILESQPVIESELFRYSVGLVLNQCMNDKEENDTIRTHCLNILRALFRHNKLGSTLDYLTTEIFHVAHLALNSSNFAIRNGGTMLFSTFMTRTFGVMRTKDLDQISMKNKMSAQVFFTRFNNMENHLLEKCRAQNEHLAADALLLILSRLYISSCDDVTMLSQFVPFVNSCLHSRSYKTRELAAGTIASIFPKHTYNMHFLELLHQLTDITLSNNYLESILLQLKYIMPLVSLKYNQPNMEKLIGNTFWIFMAVGKHMNYNLAALYFDVVARMVENFSILRGELNVFVKMVEFLLKQKLNEVEMGNLSQKENIGEKMFYRNRFFLHILLVSAAFDYKDEYKTGYLTAIIIAGLRDEEEVQYFILNYIYYLNSLIPNKLIQNALFICEEIQICEYAERTVNILSESLKENMRESLHKVMPIYLIDLLRKLVKSSKKICCMTLLVLQQYPCFIKQLKESNVQDAFNFFHSFLFGEDETVHCAALGCISILINNLLHQELKQFCFLDLIQDVVASSKQYESLPIKLTTAQFLISLKYILISSNKIITDQDKAVLWNVVVELLEDNESMVRNTASEFATDLNKDIHLSTNVDDSYGTSTSCVSRKTEESYPVIPERAKEIIANNVLLVMGEEVALNLLFQWALRRRKKCWHEDSTRTNFLIDINQYVEDKPMASYASHVLRLHLWKPVIEGHKHKDEHVVDVLMKIKQILKMISLPEDFKAVIMTIVDNIVIFLQDEGKSSVTFNNNIGKMMKKVIFMNTNNTSGASMDRDTYTFVLSILLDPPQT